MWKGRGDDRKRRSLSHPLFPGIVNLYRNFQGRRLVTAAVNDWPFFGLKILENGTVIPDRGIDVNIINALGHYLNFT